MFIFCHTVLGQGQQQLQQHKLREAQQRTSQACSSYIVSQRSKLGAESCTKQLVGKLMQPVSSAKHMTAHLACFLVQLLCWQGLRSCRPCSLGCRRLHSLWSRRVCARHRPRIVSWWLRLQCALHCLVRC